MDGIQVHADHATVNLNFWVTPDDANIDPSSGGLVVYPKAPPAELKTPGDSTRNKVWRPFVVHSRASADLTSGLRDSRSGCSSRLW